MRSAVWLTIVLAGCAGRPPGPPRPPAADMILVDAAVYTATGEVPWAEAIAIEDGAVVEVGDRRTVLRRRGPSTRVHALGGAMVLPGFVDAHVHPVTGGVELGQCNLNEATSLEAIGATIRACAETGSDTAWVVGGGWDLTLFEDAHPRREQLDAWTADRPAYLTAADAHSGWVNSAGLAEAGITAQTPDPPDGRIERDADGHPTGVLREAAMALVERVLPPITDGQRRAGLRRALTMAHGFGITTLHEANATPEVLATYVDLAERGELTAHVVVAQSIDPHRGPEQLDALVAARDRIDHERLAATSIKIFADGVIEARTAALLEPYVGYAHAGTANFSVEALTAIVGAADRRGFDVHVHAIGDRGIRMALDAFEHAIRTNPDRERRHMIAHLQLVSPPDIERFAALGIIANFQPLWAYPDAYITDLTLPVLGPVRSRWLYPIRSVQVTGAVVVAGSDWSVSSMNPLRAIEVAITRHEIEGSSPPGAWIPQETSDLAAMLAAYTRHGAYASRREHYVGTIEAGKRADLVVLDRNLFEVAATEIHRAEVLATLVDGGVVHGALP